MHLIQIVWTVIAFLLFVGIFMWAYSSKRKVDFDEAARLPLDEETIDTNQVRERNNV